MEQYSYTLTVKVLVEAFDESDAQSVIRDFFGTGPMDDIVEITDLKIK